MVSRTKTYLTPQFNIVRINVGRIAGYHVTANVIHETPLLSSNNSHPHSDNIIHISEHSHRQNQLYLSQRMAAYPISQSSNKGVLFCESLLAKCFQSAIAFQLWPKNGSNDLGPSDCR